MRLAQLDRASGYGPEGREFESSSARCENPVKSRVYEKEKASIEDAFLNLTTEVDFSVFG